MPLHPAVVHLPIGFACALPLLWAFAFARARSNEADRDRLWDAAFFLFALLVAIAALAASSTGEALLDSEIGQATEAFRRGVHEHEERAEVFLPVSFVEAGLAAAVLALGATRASWRRVLRFAALVGSLALVALAVWVGHAGGTVTHLLK